MAKEKSVIIPEAQATSFSVRDRLCWFLFSLLAVGLMAAHALYLSTAPGWISALVWVLAVVMLSGIFFLTALGKQFFHFVLEARQELYKVVFPSRQEATQTTVMVIVVVLATSLLLWMMDSLWLWVIGWLSGQRM